MILEMDEMAKVKPQTISPHRSQNSVADLGDVCFLWWIMYYDGYTMIYYENQVIYPWYTHFYPWYTMMMYCVSEWQVHM
jgi:hypothetical protein